MSTVTSNDGTTIAFERSGDGPPVVLVGGALDDRLAMEPLATHLTSHFTVYNYDRRGRGDSEDTVPYAAEREIEDLAALIAEAGGQAFVYGLSSGAMLAFEAAASGMPITKLVMFEPPYAVSETRLNSSEDFTGWLAELVAAGRRDAALEYFMTAAVGLPHEAVDEARSSPVWPRLEAMAHTLVYDTTISGDGRLPVERMALVTVPVLVIDSDGSTAWLRDSAQAVANALPQGRHCSLPGEFHDVPPEKLAPALTEFFACSTTHRTGPRTPDIGR